MDPKQVVFTGNQDLVIQGVVSGQFDVGFVRTAEIEWAKDAQGNPIDATLLKGNAVMIMCDSHKFLEVSSI